MNKPLVLIYSMGRSGGDALTNALSKAISCINSTNHQPFSTFNLFKKTYDLKEKKNHINKKIKKFRRNSNGIVIKHCVQDFLEQGTSEYEVIKLNLHLLKTTENLIINDRKNLLKLMISSLIAQKTNIWSTKGKKTPTKKIINKLKDNKIELDKSISELRRIMNSIKINFYSPVKTINDMGIDYQMGTYEEMFGDLSIDARVKKIKEIVDNLGYEYEEPNEKKLEKILNPKAKLNNKKTYSEVNNIKEINEKLGPKFGYLF